MSFPDELRILQKVSGLLHSKPGTEVANDAEGSVTQVFRRMRAGDADSAGELWQKFFPRLRAIARSALVGRRHYVTDADDAVQSAFVAFWRQAKQQTLAEVLHRDDLWNLLALITRRKALKHLERESADKRGGGRVLLESNLQADGENATVRLDTLAAGLPAAELDLLCQELLEQLDEQSRTMVLLRLMGYRNHEIAEQLNCTQRRVERKFELTRKIWSLALDRTDKVE